MRRKTKYPYLLCACLLVSYTASAQRNEGTIEQSVSADIYRQFISEHKMLTPAESPEVETLSRISGRIIQAVTSYYSSKKEAKELQGFIWEAHLFEQSKADAWCLPGGKIAVYAPIFPLTQSDGSLAVILCHEIAHIFLKHGDARMKQYLKEYLGVKDFSSALSSKPIETRDFFRMAFGNGDYVGVIRGFSSEDEMAADKLGAVYCALAGYKPEEAIVFWERMAKLKWTGHTPELLSTHPVDEKRIAGMREIMDDISLKYYKPIIKN
jgi:predicted Zn-dependent protease